MPTYEYRCGKCGEGLEIFQSIKDKPKRKCPACGANALERLISGGGAILFKGSGFYETDYRSEKYKKAAEADKKASSGDSEGSSDKKADKATESKSGGGSETKPDKPAKKGDDKLSKGSKKAASSKP
ncbi:MAG: FmdB family transcriptional regulator [Phycisphaerae bacterium]|nr:FmdB family transcriptional regulator [Phycisphaerae bacterium]